MTAAAKIQTTLGLPSPREIRASRMYRLIRLSDGFNYCSTVFPDGHGHWAWMKDSTAHHFECDEDDVGCLAADWESENPRDLITVKGVPVAYCKMPWEAE